LTEQKAYGEAKQILTESLRIRRELRDKQDIAMSLDNLGEVALYREAYDESRKLYTESLRIRRELGDKPGIADSLHQFGRLTKAEGDFRQAVLFLHAVIHLYEEMQSENSKDVMEVDESLAEIQREVGLEQFERMREYAEAISIEQLIQLALA
jgi:tetratricopeptide (TPR) repeat protein